MKPRMSFFVTRPPRPVPEIWETSTLCSEAMRATTGETKRAPSACPSSGSTGSGAGVGCAAGGSGSAATSSADGVSPSAPGGGGALGGRFLRGGLGRRLLGWSSAAGASAAGASSGAATSAPSGAITAIFVPTATVSPSCTRICWTTPVAGLGTSVSTLSVEISSSVSSASMASPSDFDHFVIVPSDTETPIWGMTTSTSVPVAISTRRAP